jgi:hypothetical protein
VAQLEVLAQDVEVHDQMHVVLEMLMGDFLTLVPVSLQASQVWMGLAEVMIAMIAVPAAGEQ